MIALLVGGSKSGKSSLAQKLAGYLANGAPKYYLATMRPVDTEDRERIRRHLDDRAGLDFVTVEQGLHIEDSLRAMDGRGTVLLDSLTALLTNEFFRAERSYAPDPDAARRVTEGLTGLSQGVTHLVAVGDDVFRDAAHYSAETEAFRAALAQVYRALAGQADLVIEATAGLPAVWKGEWPL